MHVLFSTLIGFIAFSSLPMSALDRDLCPGILLESKLPISFTKAEKELVCDNYGSLNWSRIPIQQKIYFLKNFLQARAYHQPSFQPDGDQLRVNVGPQSVIRRIVVEGNIAGIDPKRYWPVYHRPMTPKALDQIQAWFLQEYGRQDYLCARVDIEAYPESEEVRVIVQASTQKQLLQVNAESIPNLLRNVPRRFDAFTIGEPLSNLEMDLTAQRTMEEELVVSTSFQIKCLKNGIVLDQTFMPGEPRLVSFGAGFDTEELGIFQARWKNNRFTELASTLDLSLHVSYRRIEAFTAFDWYYAPIVMQHYVRNVFSYERQNEANYDSRQVTLKTGPAWQSDYDDLSVLIWGYLGLAQTDLVRGQGEPTSRWLSLNLHNRWQTHDFEFFRNDPRSGYQASLNLAYWKSLTAESISFRRYQLTGTRYLNLFNLDPAIWILGIRGAWSGLWVPGGLKDDDQGKIPANYKFRLGGASDMRGFERRQIAEQGALTSAYLGFELRINHSLPFGLQPLLLLDSAKVSRQPFSLERPTFWSPGLGLHWQSLVGTLRASLAYGFVEDAASNFEGDQGGWQIYLSFGEQF